MRRRRDTAEQRRRRDTAGRNLMDLVQAAVLLSLGLFLLSGAWAARAQERLAGQVIRLHVLASSDRPEDQARKLRVRDAVLSRTELFLRDAESRDEAECVLRERLPDLRTAAASVLAREGCTDGVRVELAETDFPTRVYDGEYGAAGVYGGIAMEISAHGGTAMRTGTDGGERDGFALPAGRYLALRVIIGPGEGRNWWCVVFPPLCGGTERKSTEGESIKEAEEAPPPGEAEKGREAPNPETRTRKPLIPAPPEAGAGECAEQDAASDVSKPASPAPAAPAVPVVPDISAAPTAPAVPAPASAVPAVPPVRGLPPASRRYEVRFRVVELWGHIRAALS